MPEIKIDDNRTPRVPFYRVFRGQRGIVEGCIKDNDIECRCCLFANHCVFNAKVK